MREPSPEELFGVKPLQPTEQRRWKNHRMVIQDYGHEFQSRLNELKEKSKELTAILTRKFAEANLPFGIKKDQAGIIRLSFFFRPNLLLSDLSPAQKAEQRHHTADDEISIFFHLDEDNQIEALRFGHGREAGPFSIALIYGLKINPQKDAERITVDLSDLTGFADLIIEKLLTQPLIKDLQNLLVSENIETVNQTINEYDSWWILSDFMKKRILQQTLAHLCQSQTKTLFIDRLPWDQVKKHLEETIDTFLKIEFPLRARNPKPLSTILFNSEITLSTNQELIAFKNSILKQAKDLYQKMKFTKK